MEILHDYSLGEIKNLIEEMGEKPFRAGQIFRGLHSGKRISEITDISKDFRNKLLERFVDFPVEIIGSKRSEIDGTEKFLFKLWDNNVIEGVLMKYKYGNTQCVSTQVGCRMGCAFCASGIGGLVRNLTAGEILGQITAVNAYLGGKAYETNASILTRMKPLGASVLYILPYVGLDYEKISLDGVEAVVHGTYHSDSVCVERSGGEGSVSGFSILTLIERCKQANIPLMLAPCNREAYRYESTGDALRSVAYAAEGMTVEMSYVKTLVGCALGYQGTDLVRFVERSVNYEVR